jgi:hypothetical protein
MSDSKNQGKMAFFQVLILEMLHVVKSEIDLETAAAGKENTF